MKQKISKQLVKHIAQLAQIPITVKEEKELANDFSETLTVVDQLQQISTINIEPTHQVTGLQNIIREDKVDQKHMFTQKQALANASRTHDGFFVVERVIHAE